jgi:hypothetical protein
MKEIIAIIGTVVLIVSLWSFAKAESISNKVMKQCVEMYKPDWNKAAACHSDYRVGQRKTDNEKIKKLLAEKPWFRGKNWNWEEPAKLNYSCRKDLSNGATICQRPYYIN